jgi:hypothetical protein
VKAFGALGCGFPALLACGLGAAPAAAQEPAPSEVAAKAAADLASTDPAAAPVPPSTPPKYDLPPPGTRWALFGTGLAVTGVSYGMALGASYIWPDARYANELRVPIAGPWMAIIGDTGCPKHDPDCSTVLLVVVAVLTGIDGVLQAGGVGMALESVFLPTSSTPKGGAPASPTKKTATRPIQVTAHPVPIVAGRDGVGLGVVGTF